MDDIIYDETREERDENVKLNEMLLGNVDGGKQSKEWVI